MDITQYRIRFDQSSGKHFIEVKSGDLINSFSASIYSKRSIARINKAKSQIKKELLEEQTELELEAS